MDATMVYVMMVVVGLLMALLPFGVFLGLGTVLGINSADPRLLITYFLLAAVCMYLASFGAFSLIQYNNCKKNPNLKQAATNASIALGIQAFTLLLTWFFPYLRGIVTGLFPPDMSVELADSLSYGYYSFWAALFGTAVGGTLSGICAT